MPPREQVLRRALAAHPELIEPGLQVVGQEVAVPNAIGTRGFIDILARDRFGDFVVVELKRSDSAAREALHELAKYVGLLHRERGIPRERIRCVLASTHWDELRVPFAVASREFPVDLRGYELQMDGDEVVAAIPVDALAQPSPRGLTLVQRAYCFWDRADRDALFGLLAAELEAAGCPDAIGVHFDNDDERWPGYPFILYVAVGRATAEATELARAAVSADEFANEPPHGFVAEERAIESAKSGRSCDELEIGYAEKFAQLRSGPYGWSMVYVERAGMFAAQEGLVTDDDLAADLQGYDGGNISIYQRTFSPLVSGALDRTLAEVSDHLKSVPSWRDGLVWWLREHADAEEITVVIRTPYDLPRAMIARHRGKEYWHATPALLAHVGGNEGTDEPLDALTGTLAWERISAPIWESFLTAYLDPVLWGMLKDPESDATFLRELGLTHRLLVRTPGTPPLLVPIPAGESDPLPHDVVESVGSGVRLRWDGLRWIDEFLDEKASELAYLAEVLEDAEINTFDRWWNAADGDASTEEPSAT